MSLQLITRVARLPVDRVVRCLVVVIVHEMPHLNIVRPVRDVHHKSLDVSYPLPRGGNLFALPQATTPSQFFPRNTTPKKERFGCAVDGSMPFHRATLSHMGHMGRLPLRGCLPSSCQTCTPTRPARLQTDTRRPKRGCAAGRHTARA